MIYCLKTEEIDYLPAGGGGSFTFSHRTPPFPITAGPATLTEHSLPGPVAELYRKNNVAVAAVPVLLDGPRADGIPWFVAATFCGLAGIFCLIAAARRALRQLWQRKT